MKKKIHIDLFYDEENYNIHVISILDSIQSFKKTGVSINRTNFFNTYNKIKNKYSNTLPIQIFTGSPKSYYRKPLDKTEIKNFNLLKLQNSKIKIFIHSIYIINLSRDISLNQQLNNYLEKEFMIGKTINSHGIVFHVGKEINMGKEKAIEKMKFNILNILDLATSSTPFILETPAGQGTELLTTYEDFSDFYNDIMSYNISKKRFKICIDTCHVFASGIDPFKYIENWIFDYGSDSIALIHFNDSCGKFGCKKDRHEIPGNGYIGKNMENIYNLCIEHNLNLVYE